MSFDDFFAWNKSVEDVLGKGHLNIKVLRLTFPVELSQGSAVKPFWQVSHSFLHFTFRSWVSGSVSGFHLVSDTRLSQVYESLSIFVQR